MKAVPSYILAQWFVTSLCIEMNASHPIESRDPHARQGAIGEFFGILLATAIALCALCVGGTAAAAPIEHARGDAAGGVSPLSISGVTGFPSILGRDGMVTAAWHGGTASHAAEQPTQTPATPLLSLPAPAALWLFGSGLCALGLTRRRIMAPWRRHKARREELAAADRLSPPSRDWRRALRQRMRHASATQFCNGGGFHSFSGRPPGAPDGRGGAGDPPQRAVVSGLMQRRFEELAAALVEQPNVATGRGFGCPCIKFGKRPFLAFDERIGGIAFWVGEQSAGDLLAELSLVEHWNPKQERQAKRSWLVCRVINGEALVQLAAAAYEHALAEVEQPVARGSRPTMEFASA